jgi:hypothetical protein
MYAHVNSLILQSVKNFGRAEYNRDYFQNEFGKVPWKSTLRNWFIKKKIGVTELIFEKNSESCDIFGYLVLPLFVIVVMETFIRILLVCDTSYYVLQL